MHFDLITETAKKQIKERINRGANAPLILQYFELLEFVRQFEPSVTASNIEEAIDHLTQQKAISFSDGRYAIFRLSFVDNGRLSDKYVPYLNANFKRLTDRDEIKNKPMIIAKYPVIGDAQADFDKTDIGNMELYQLQNVTDTHLTLGIPEKHMYDLERLTGVKGQTVNILDEVPIREAIESKKYWIAQEQ